MAKAIAYFGEAALEDPAWAAPHAGLATAHVLLGLAGIVAPAKAARLAAECAARALEDDPALPDAHVSAALVAFFGDWDLGAARRSLERALSLQPEAHATRLLYGLLLGLSGDFEGARRELGRAREADPLSGLAGAVVAFFQGLVGEPERRLHSARRALELRPDRVLSYWALGQAHEGLGHHGRAVAALRRAVELTDGGTVMKAQLAWALARAGHSTEARALLRELDRVSGHTFVSPYHRALALVALGERERSLAALERAAEARDPWLVFLKADPALRGLRGEPRYESLVARVLRP